MIRVEKLEHNGFKYLLYYPVNYVEGKKYPVMFHLHGSGGRGKDFEGFEGSPLLAILNKGNSPLNQGFCVFPQCSTDTWFDRFSELLKFTKYIYNQPYTDKKRFNASGISMGGYGIYQVMMSLPKLFNKAVVCCGGGMYWNAYRMKKIKVRIFHGEKDMDVFPEESKRMYDRLKEAEGDVVLTMYPECDHDCWNKTYSNFDLMKWFFE